MINYKKAWKELKQYCIDEYSIYHNGEGDTIAENSCGQAMFKEVITKINELEKTNERKSTDSGINESMSDFMTQVIVAYQDNNMTSFNFNMLRFAEELENNGDISGAQKIRDILAGKRL